MSIKELLRLIPEKYSDLQTEASLIWVFPEQNGFSRSAAGTMPSRLQEKVVLGICRLLHTRTSLTLPFLKSVLEEMTDLQERGKNGVVFIPDYTADYILEYTIVSPCPPNTRVTDPTCGNGSLLLPVTEYPHRISGRPMRGTTSEHLHGIDINGGQTRRTRVFLTLLILLAGGTADGLSLHIATADSLACSWTDLSGCPDSDCIADSPPYLNIHAISKRDTERLKRDFPTTRRGTLNLFYAPAEQNLRLPSKWGTLGFAVPNNYLPISSAEELRRLLNERRAVSMVIDLGGSLVLEPVRIYSSLLFLSRCKSHTVAYSMPEKSNDLPAALRCTVPCHTDTEHLNLAGWKLLSETERRNIKRIEEAGQSTGNQIKISVATLRGNVYFPNDFDPQAGLFHEECGNLHYWVEPDAVRATDEISEISDEMATPGERKHILLPYTGEPNHKMSYRVPGEEQLTFKFLLCYQYPIDCRPVFAARDKGESNPVARYTYDRSQGLNCYGPKLLFPMFSRRSKFLPEPDGEIPLHNGHAIAQGGRYPLEVLVRILNSNVMEYYTSCASYCLKSDYKCYQKRYLRSFSIPEFSESEIRFLLSGSSDETTNAFLF